MSQPLESFQFMNRGWDIRVLESRSLRSLFIVLLVDSFMLGMLAFMMVYEIVRRHRFDWSTAVLLPVFILSLVRYAPLIYRRLHQQPRES